MTYTIKLSDGTVVGAGQSLPSLGSVKVTASAFPGTEADPGGVCARELEAVFFAQDLQLSAGDTLLLYRDGVLQGSFLAEKPTASPGRCRVLAYDFVTKLDKDLTQWLESLTDWPYALSDFARMVCAACGVSLRGTLENSDWPIPEFKARGITGRQLMQWVCQAGCRCCTADPEGVLELHWLRHSGITLSPTGQHFYFGGMTHGDCPSVPPDGVQIGLTDNDVGVVSDPEAESLLCIRGNYLLCGCGDAQAKAIAAQLPQAYTPCQLETTVELVPGEYFTLDTGSALLTALAMTVEEQAGRFRVTCTGSASRNASSAVCRGDYRAMSGRVLELTFGLQGVSTRLAQYEGEQEKYSLLSQDVDAVTARVGELENETDTRFSQLELRSDGMELSVNALSGALEGKADSEELGTLKEHFLFNEKGMTISDSSTGMSILVSQKEVAFQEGTAITPTRMTTTNLQVESHLTVGGFTLLPRTGGNLSLRYTG